MDEKTYLDLYRQRDGTTSFMRSLNRFPQAERIFTEDPLRRKDTLFEIAIVGCSSGMEVYSYGMLCETNGFADYRVDGYDVHPDRLKEGKRGWYHVWWGTELALTDPRVKRGLAFRGNERKYGQEVIFVDKKIKERTRFFQHDISLEPLATLYDIVVCTNVLGQPQRGGRENAIANLVKSVKEGGLIVQNYGPFHVDGELEKRVNLKLQRDLGLLI